MNQPRKYENYNYSAQQPKQQKVQRPNPARKRRRKPNKQRRDGLMVIALALFSAIAGVGVGANLAEREQDKLQTAPISSVPLSEIPVNGENKLAPELRDEFSLSLAAKINITRTENDLPKLIVDPELSELAVQRARKMAEDGDTKQDTKPNDGASTPKAEMRDVVEILKMEPVTIDKVHDRLMQDTTNREALMSEDVNGIGVIVDRTNEKAYVSIKTRGPAK